MKTCERRLALPIGDRYVDVALKILELRFHALRLRRLSGAYQMTIGWGFESGWRFQIVQRQVIRRAFERRETLRPQKAGQRHALGKMFLLVVPVANLIRLANSSESGEASPDD